MGLTGVEIEKIRQRVRLADYLVVAQLFLRDNFFLERELEFNDIKPRLLGHWGTCHGVNVIFANLKRAFRERELQFILGPGHGFPALNANLFLDGELEKVDKQATRNRAGVEYLCRNFSTPEGFPSHSSPLMPGVVTEGGELGYALGTAFGVVLGHPEKTVAVVIGDGEFETGTALASLNFEKLISGGTNGRVLPILHLNGYKISGPTVMARKSEREQNEMIRGFGFEPLRVDEGVEKFQFALEKAKRLENPFLIFESEKGETGPDEVNGNKVRGNYLAHQIPLPEAKTNETQLRQLEEWLRSYGVAEILSKEEIKL